MAKDDRCSTRSLTVVVAPDSFKGSISAEGASRALADGWLATRAQDNVLAIPMADGGEGTASAVAASYPGARWHRSVVTGPDGSPVEALWLELPDGTALVEVASSSGLPLMKRLDAVGATSKGLGQLIRAALQHKNITQLVVCLGGSATTDGGAGALHALGARFSDSSGRAVEPHGGRLLEIHAVDVEGLIPPPVRGVVLLTDVNAPLHGPHGAARQFAPQKGASSPEVLLLEQGLWQWSTLLGGDPSLHGSGAAGGIAYGLATLWGAAIRPGAQIVGETVQLDAAIAAADVVITGEGRFDAQSTQGKVVGHVLELCERWDKSAHLACGQRSRNFAFEGNALGRVEELTALAGSVSSATRDAERWLHVAGRRLALSH